MSDPSQLLEPLFDAAREEDEFEYCCTLLRVRGMEAPGNDPTTESLDLLQQIGALLNAPLQNDLRLRLSLFLYSHVTEMADLYNIPANLLRVINGSRYSMDPFQQLPKAPKLEAGDPSNDRVNQLAALAVDSGYESVAELYRFLYVRQVRNAFFHSDYALGSSSFNLRAGEGLALKGVITRSVPYEWLTPRLQAGINTALFLLSEILHRASEYKENKIVQGRLGHGGSVVDIELTTDPAHGLVGFQSPPQSGSEKSAG